MKITAVITKAGAKAAKAAAKVALAAALLAAPAGNPLAPPPAQAQSSEGGRNHVIARVWATHENTRLVLESDSRLPYSVSDTETPPQLLLDINLSDISPQLINSLAQPQQPYLTGMRAATAGQKLRIKFALGDIIHYRIHRLKPINRYRHRLVIDITPRRPPQDPLLALLNKLDRAPAPGGDGQKAGQEKRFVVLIDPGHGGEDPGAVSPNNRYEKHLVLDISRLLAREINRRAGMKAVLTRDSDRFIPLFNRVHIAHKLNVDAFVSIHADSVKNRKARGSSVFILSKKGASSRFARQLADQENLSDLIGGQPTAAADPLIESTLRQFSQDGKDRASRLLAELMLQQLGNINKLHSKTIQSAGFAVLKSPSIPSVLVETAFISNAQEERKLLDKNFQRQLAVSLASALDTYRKEHHTPE